MVEKKVADTILEEGKTVDINGATYTVAPPSTATLIRVSELIAKLPKINSEGDVLMESLRVARNTSVLGDIAATLVLGVRKKNRWKDVFKFFLKHRRWPNVRHLSKEILQLSPSKLNEIIIVHLKLMEVADFFGLTTSLSEVNLLKPTKEVVTQTTETTASGHL